MHLSAKACVAAAAIILMAAPAVGEAVSPKSKQSANTFKLSTTKKTTHGVVAKRKVTRKKRKKATRISGSDRRAKYLALAKTVKPAGLPLSLVDAVITMESRYDPAARGQHGEIGLMQVKPATARMVRSLTGVKAGALSVPVHNLRIGMAYLNWCYKRAKSNIPATIGCYNAGPGNMWKWHKFAVTRKYVRFVRSRVASN